MRVSLNHGGGSFIASPEEAADFVRDADEPGEYALADVWMSPAEVAKLPEFMGF